MHCIAVLTSIEFRHGPIGSSDQTTCTSGGITVFLVFVTKLIGSGHTGVRLEDTEIPTGQGEI